MTVTDNCDSKTVKAVSVTSDEPVEDQSGDGNFSPDARLVRDAAGNITGLRLRSERKGDADGRVYLIMVSATDAAGNMGVACTAVTVTHSQSKADQASVAAQAAGAVAACKPLPYNVLGPPPDGPAPVVGPKQ